MDQFVIRKTIDNKIYKKYSFNHNQGFGYITLKKYGDIWNLEFINMYPTGKGLGTIFLNKVLELENLSPKNMTVHTTSKDAQRFFRRQGFNT